MAGGIFIILLTLAAIFAPLITPYGFAHQDLTAILQNPSSKHVPGGWHIHPGNRTWYRPADRRNCRVRRRTG
jgi:proteasome lid subunit RPN8/RPN11